MEGNYTFAGINEVEAQDRHDEYRTGVPALGDGQTLLDAPAPDARKILSKVHLHNTGSHAALLRLQHQGATKSVGAEILSSFDVGGNRFTGSLQFKALVPGTVVVTEGGALADIVDDGAGTLHDLGIPANVRGTVDYVNGLLDLTWGGAATAPVTVAYDHQDATDFSSAAQALTATAAGAYPETFQSTVGRVIPGSVSLTDGALTFVDDGKGNMIETTGGIATVVGTVDYGTGLVTLTSGTAPMSAVVDATTLTTSYNPFASLLQPGGQATADFLNSQIPELTQEPWADGLKGESRVSLWGECLTAAQTNLITKWYHASEDPFRVDAPFSGFPAGGHDNDPRLA